MQNYEIVIRPERKRDYLNLAELWRYRELFYIFTWRDIKVKYKQTVLGVIWVGFQPLVTTVIFTFFFGNLAKIPSNNLPYPIFVLSGLVFWNYFSSSLSFATNSLVDNESIIKKIYFPKIILPISSIITGCIDFAINMIILFMVMIYYQIVPSLLILITIPIGLLITAITASGIGLLLSAFNVKYRDVRYILPFFIQILIFLTPVIYPLSIATPEHQLFLALNPMTGVIESIRSSIGNTPINYGILLLSICSAVIIFMIGLLYFRRTERFFADIV